MCHGSFKGFPRKFLRCFKEFQGCLKELYGCLKDVSKLFHGSFESVSKKIVGCSERPFKVNGYLKEVQRVFQCSFKDV